MTLKHGKTGTTVSRYLNGISYMSNTNTSTMPIHLIFSAAREGVVVPLTTFYHFTWSLTADSQLPHHVLKFWVALHNRDHHAWGTTNCCIESERESPLLPHQPEDTRPSTLRVWWELLSVISQDHGRKLEREELWSNSLFKTNDCHMTLGRYTCFLMFHLLTLSYILKKFTGERAQEATRMKVLHLIGATLNGWAVLSGSYFTVGQIEGHSVFFAQLLIT